MPKAARCAWWHGGTAVRLSGYDCEFIKQVAIAAGLPVIDSRTVPYDLAAKLAAKGPMTADNEPPRPRPWNAFSFAQLKAVGAAYRKAGVEVFNLQKLSNTTRFSMRCR